MKKKLLLVLWACGALGFISLVLPNSATAEVVGNFLTSNGINFLNGSILIGPNGKICNKLGTECMRDNGASGLQFVSTSDSGVLTINSFLDTKDGIRASIRDGGAAAAVTGNATVSGTLTVDKVTITTDFAASTWRATPGGDIIFIDNQGAGAGNLIRGRETDGTTARANILSNLNTLTSSVGASAQIASFDNPLNTQRATVDPAGNYRQCTASNCSTYNIATVYHSTTAQAMEAGDATLSGGSVTVNFTTAFSSAPACSCSNIQAVPIACGPSATPSTSAVTFVVPGGLATHIGWQCIGPK